MAFALERAPKDVAFALERAPRETPRDLATNPVCLGVVDSVCVFPLPSTLTAPSDPPSAWSPIFASSIADSGFIDISCPDASNCYAVGAAGAQPSEVPAVASTHDGGLTWSESTLPGTGELDGVACTSPTSCIASGATAARGGNLVILTTTNGGASWGPARFPATQGAGGGVTCATPTSCYEAASPVISGQTGAEILSSTDAGQSWSVSFSSSAFNPLQFNFYTRLACPSPTSCIGAGVVFSFGPSGAPTFTSISISTTNAGATWTTTPMAAPVTLPGTFAPPEHASCASLTHCVVGTFAFSQSSSGPQGANSVIFQTTDFGGTWTSTSVGPPATSTSGTEIFGMSCSGGSCVAFGDIYTIEVVGSTIYLAPGEPLVFSSSDSGATWQPTSPPAAPNPATPAVLAGVSCDSAIHCFGSGGVAAGVPGLVSSSGLAFQGTPSAPPSIAALSPPAAPAAADPTVTITGSGFTGTTGVVFGSTHALSFAVVSNTQMTAVAPQGSGTVEVHIGGSNGISPTTVSSADKYTYLPPVVTSISPTQGAVNAETAVTITGSAFTGATSVSFGAAPAVSYQVVSDLTISAVAPRGIGTVDVRVTTIGGTSATSSSDTYTYFPPAVTSVSPPSGPAAGGTLVTITGRYFTGVDAVVFGPRPASSFTVVSDTTITALSPAGAGPVAVSVSGPYGGSSSTATASNTFTYLSPKVTAVSPSSGYTYGGITVTISGVNFSFATKVSFGFQSVSFQLVSDSTITATAAPGTGTVDITVTSAGGTSATSSADQFTYVAPPPPEITSISPSSGPADGGTAVTITGSHFTSVSSVTFSTQSAIYIFVSDSQLIATSPAGSGTVVVSVVTAGGTSAPNLADLFSYIAPPPPPSVMTPTETNGGSNPSEKSTTCNRGTAPVNCATGNFWHTTTDISIPGRGLALSFTRTYNASTAASYGPLGHGWSDSYDMYLSNDAAGNITVNQENASTVSFSPNGSGGYVAPTRVFATLVRNPDGTWAFARAKRQFYVFSSTGLLVSEGDLNGYTTSLSYNAAGQLVTVTDPAGRRLAFSYDASGLISKITDPGRRAVSFTYDSAGNLASVTDVAGGITTFTYDSSHRMLGMVDPLGHTVTNAYDSAGRIANQTDPMGRVTSYVYSGDNFSDHGGTTAITDPRGVTDVQSYSNGELTSDVSAFGTALASTRTYTYDPVTLGTSSYTDPDGHVTTATYDLAGNLTSITDAAGRTRDLTYDFLNDIVSSTDALGVVTTNTYDARGNLTSTSTPSGTGPNRVVTLAYLDSAHPGDITAVTDPNGHTSNFAYDADGDLVSYRDPIGDTTTSTFNAIGEMTGTVSPRGNAPGDDPASFTTTFIYDARGDLVASTDPLGHTSRLSFDADANLLSTTDPSGNTTTYTYDADNEKVSTTRADGTTMANTYDANGNQVATTDANAGTTIYVFDALDRFVSTTDPLGHVTSYGYDPAGNETTMVEPDGVTTSYSHDAVDELTGIAYSDGSTPGLSFSYDANGRRVAMHDGTGTSTFTYDALGRLTSTTNGAGAIVSYSFDPAGNTTGITYPSGQVVTYAFDSANRMTGVTDWLGHITSFSYDADGKRIATGYPNGTISTVAYDAANQASSITDTKGSSTMASFTYARNSDALVSSATTTGIPQPQPFQSYSYSAVNALVKVNTQAYGYDKVGNMASLPDGSSFTYNAADELTRASRGSSVTIFDYDANGNRRGQSGPGQGAGQCVLCVLDSQSPGSLSATGSAQINSGGVVAANSTSTRAVTATGSALIGASKLFVAGATSTTGTSTITGLEPASSGIAGNPFGSESAPVVPQESQSLSVPGSSATNASPGLYSNISVSGTASLTLSPGTYVVTGSISVSGSAKLTGTGVTIYLACSNYPSPCPPASTGAGIAASGSGSISLSGPASGNQVTIGADPNNTATLSDAGNRSVTVTGSIDVPSGKLTATGTATISVSNGVVAIGDVVATGNALIRVDAAPASVPPTAYSYDAANRLIGVSAAAVQAEYSYNGDNLRSSATTNGVTTHFVWGSLGAGPQLLSDSTNQYIYGPGGVAPIEQVTAASGSVSYLYTDQLGSVAMAVDQAGIVTETETFTAYGSLASESGSGVTSFGFAGSYTDPTALVYLINRYYDPATGQFLAVDPFVILSSQPYEYSFGNPVNNKDSNGLLGMTCWTKRNGEKVPLPTCIYPNYTPYGSLQVEGFGQGINQPGNGFQVNISLANPQETPTMDCVKNYGNWSLCGGDSGSSCPGTGAGGYTSNFSSWCWFTGPGLYKVWIQDYPNWYIMLYAWWGTFANANAHMKTRCR